MSINRVSSSRLPYYGPAAAANGAPAARPAAVANETPVASAARETATPAASPLETAFQQARVTATNGDPNSGRSSYAAAIGLYQRVSQYSDDRSSASGLMKSWNDIVRENQFEDAGVAGYVKAVAQNDTVALPSRVLHLTA